MGKTPSVPRPGPLMKPGGVQSNKPKPWGCGDERGQALQAPRLRFFWRRTGAACRLGRTCVGGQLPAGRNTFPQELTLMKTRQWAKTAEAVAFACWALVLIVMVVGYFWTIN